MEFTIQVATFVLIWGLLAASLNLYVGYTGLVSVAHASLFGIGAYTSSLTAIRLGAPFPVSLGLALALGAAAGALLAVPLLRVKGDAQVIITLAFQGLCFSLFNNLDALTGGPSGLPGIPRPFPSWFAGNSEIASFLVTVTVFAASIALLHRLVVSPFGRMLIAIRDNEKFAVAMGKNVTRHKVEVSVIAGAIAAAAGALYAQYVGYIDPSTFNLAESFSILCIVIIGGAGSFLGPLIGAMFIVLLPEFLLFVGIPSAQAANWRQIIFGAVIVILMIWRPQGLLGTYEFRGNEK
jgi:branched-chain amino acid transport system permease protein